MSQEEITCKASGKTIINQGHFDAERKGSTIVWPFPEEFHVKAEALQPKGVPSMLAMAEYHEALANLASEYKAHGDFSAYIKGQLVCAGDYRKLAEERGE